MSLIIRFPSTFLCAASLLFGFAMLGGCSATKEAEMRAAEMLRQNTILQKKNNQLVMEVDEGKVISARLQMKLVEKQAEIARLRFSQQSLSQKVVLHPLRMPTPSTKVETATYLAEVEMEITTAREFARGGSQQIFLQADSLMAESKAELDKGNYDKACALAAQAMKLVRNVRIQTSLHNQVGTSTYADFISPLQLELAKRSNIRKNPGIRSKLIETQDKGKPITAIGYKGNWVKVILQNGQNGWIYYSLLIIPKQQSLLLDQSSEIRQAHPH
jgi:hypothetical protein